MESKRLELSPPILIEARGPDALRYLNGQVTQDVRSVVSSGRSMTSCVTDAKGRLQFRVLIHPVADGAIRVSCDHDGAEGLFARLDRYLVADDAVLEDLSDGWLRVHVTGNTAPGVPGGGYAVAADRVGIPGWDVWYPTGVSEESLAHLPVWSGAEAESFRITAGIPAWGSELEPGLLPPEAGLDRTDVSYSKGCYIGQEVISRIKSAGKVNRRLMRLRLDEGIPCLPGELLVDEEGGEAGLITSVAPVPSDGERAVLGYIRRSAEGRRVHLKSCPEATVSLVCKA